MKNHLLFILIVFCVASLLRLWQLGNIPLSMTDDEIRLTYNAYSIWQTGKDINGQTLPAVFLVDGYAFNPVPVYLTSPFVGLLGLSMFAARLPFALTGILTVLFFYGIGYQLSKNKMIGFLTALAVAFSAWHLQLSRFSYEGEFALFFYSAGILIFLLVKKKQIMAVSFAMMLFLLAFYSYSGTKLLFLPILGILVWYKHTLLSRKQFLIIIIFTLATFFSFLFLSKTQHAADYGPKQFFFQNTTSEVATAVELERRASTAPQLLKVLYHNKFTVQSRIFLEHYAYAFSLQYLFLDQEASGIFSLWFRGQLYYIELPLIIMGFLYLFQRRKRESILLLLFLLIGPIPSGLGAEPLTYTIRSSFMLLPLMIFSGSGIYAISYFVVHKTLQKELYILLILFYTYFIGGYLTQYYFEWSLYGAKYYNVITKDGVQFALKKKNEGRNTFFARVSTMTLLHYAFYAKLSPKEIQRVRKTMTLPVVIDTIHFQQKCFVFKKDKNGAVALSQNVVYIEDILCNKSLKPSYTIKASNGIDDEWKVYEN